MSIAINALNNIKNGNLGFDKVKSGYSILSIRDIIKLFINGGWTVEAVQRGGREAREFARNMLATICYSVVAHGYDSAKLPSEGIEVYVNKTDNFSIRIEKDDKNIPRFVYYNIKIETNPLNKEEIIILLDNPPKIVLSEAIPDNFQQLCENAIEQSLSTNPGEYRCLVFNALKDAKLNLITKIDRKSVV